MLRQASASELREIMRIADKLTTYVRETSDPKYTQLFLEASEALKQRARDLTQGEESGIPPCGINIVV